MGGGGDSHGVVVSAVSVGRLGRVFVDDDGHGRFVGVGLVLLGGDDGGGGGNGGNGGELHGWRMTERPWRLQSAFYRAIKIFAAFVFVCMYQWVWVQKMAHPQQLAADVFFPSAKTVLASEIDDRLKIV